MLFWIPCTVISLVSTPTYHTVLKLKKTFLLNFSSQRNVSSQNKWHNQLRPYHCKKCWRVSLSLSLSLSHTHTHPLRRNITFWLCSNNRDFYCDNVCSFFTLSQYHTEKIILRKWLAIPFNAKGVVIKLWFKKEKNCCQAKTLMWFQVVYKCIILRSQMMQIVELSRLAKN